MPTNTEKKNCEEKIHLFYGVLTNFLNKPLFWGVLTDYRSSWSRKLYLKAGNHIISSYDLITYQCRRRPYGEYHWSSIKRANRYYIQLPQHFLMLVTQVIFQCWIFHVPNACVNICFAMNAITCMPMKSFFNIFYIDKK